MGERSGLSGASKPLPIHQPICIMHIVPLVEPGFDGVLRHPLRSTCPTKSLQIVGVISSIRRT